MISGGEPLMHPEIKDIFKILDVLGINIELNTNGLLIHKHLWLATSTISEIIISIDGINNEEYKAIRGIAKLDLVIKNLYLLKEINPKQKVGARITLTTYTLKDIKRTVEFILNNGFDYIGFSPIDLFSNSFSRYTQKRDIQITQKKSLIPDIPALEKIASDLKNKNSDLAIFIDSNYTKNKIGWNTNDFMKCINFYMDNHNDYLRSNSPCNFPYTSIVIDYDGSIKNCFYSESIGNIYDFDSINWHTTKALSNLKKNNTCSTCRGKVFCG